MFISYSYSMASCTKNDPWSHDRETYFLKTVDPAQNFDCTWRRATTAGPNRAHISAMCIKKKDCCC